MTSAINPNNIDGAYPVAGQDNNSQGFRDNFTNTKTNFQYAAAEISDLQSKAVLKSALTGTTLNNDMLGSILSNAQLQQMSGTVVSLGTLTGDVGINYAAGPYQTVSTSGSISLAFTNWTPAGTADSVLVQVTITNVAYTLTLPSAVGAGASAASLEGIQGIDVGTNTITFAQTGTYIFEFITTDSGSTIYINDITRGRNSFSGPIVITDTTQSTSTTTGSIVTAGGVGIAGNLYVGGNIVGNIEIENISSIIGNVTAGNLLTGGITSATGNVTGGNLRTAGLVSATGDVTGGNILTGGLISATGNITSGGTISAVGNVIVSGLIGATGNISGANCSVNGFMSASGNITSAGTAYLSSSEDLASSGAANLAVTTSYFTTGGSETATLAAGQAGQIKVFNAVDVTAGNMVITVTNAGWKASGTGTITFSAIGQSCILMYNASKWFAIGNNGAVFG